MTTKIERMAEDAILGAKENYDEYFIAGFKKAIELASQFCERKGYRYLHEKTGDIAALEVIKHLESFLEDEKL